jgi:uncharacterized membrane protein
MSRPGVPHLLALVLTAGAVAWAAACIAAPHVRATAPSEWVYRLASAVCHQRPERSFAIQGVQLPVCARCLGLYLAGAAGALAAWFGRRKAPANSRALLFVAALPTVITIPVEWLGLSGLSNTIRAVAALPLGAAAGWTFVRALREEGTSDANAL